MVQYGHANAGIWGYSVKGTAAVLWGQWRLVNGAELYDLSADPAQARDVSSENPDVAARMSAYYDEWWAGVGDNLSVYQPLVVGSMRENPMRLCSADWAWVYADNPKGIRGAVMDSGPWHVRVDRDGVYDLSLRRWPVESGLGITDPAPALDGVDGTLPAGRALPAATAWLRAGSHESTLPVPGDADHVRFTAQLDRGPAQIRSWWMDADGRRLASAYYLTVERRA